jgi:hypothetical protein
VQTATGSKYGGPAGTIAVLLGAFKETGPGAGTFYQIVLDQFAQFMAFPHSKTPVGCWYQERFGVDRTSGL